MKRISVKVCTGISFVCFLASIAFGHTDISVIDAAAIIAANPSLTIIDIRQRDEFCDAAGHISNAVNYVWNSDEFRDFIGQCDSDADVLIYDGGNDRCHLGAAYLDACGFSNVYEMGGGMDQWNYDTEVCIDTDNDGVQNDLDNCPNVYNPFQFDGDGDGIGDECDGEPGYPSTNSVNNVDFAVFSAYWCIGNATADINKDGWIDIADIGYFANYWMTSKN
jgi:rhodanese-related sulfurtransferase